jgi:hypothetical protein
LLDPDPAVGEDVLCGDGNGLAISGSRANELHQAAARIVRMHVDLVPHLGRFRAAEYPKARCTESLDRGIDVVDHHRDVMQSRPGVRYEIAYGAVGGRLEQLDLATPAKLTCAERSADSGARPPLMSTPPRPSTNSVISRAN